MSKNWEVLARENYTNNLGFFDVDYNRYIFVVKGLPNSLTRDLATLKPTLLTSHRPRPLTAGPIQEAKITESLLLMLHQLWSIAYGPPFMVRKLWIIPSYLNDLKLCRLVWFVIIPQITKGPKSTGFY